MGLIREPKGVDLIVESSILTNEDRKMISEIITNYKKTGRLPSKVKKQMQLRKRRSTTHNRLTVNKNEL